MDQSFEKVFLITLGVFSLFYGIWENCKNKYIQKYFEDAKWTDKIKVFVLVTLHYMIFGLIFLPIIFYFFYSESFTLSYLMAYFIFITIILTTWYFNENQCIITVWTNNMINLDGNFGFRNPYILLMNYYPVVGVGEPSLRDKIEYMILLSLVAITGFLIYRKQQKAFVVDNSEIKMDNE